MSADKGRDLDLMFGSPNSKEEAAQLAKAWGVRRVRIYRKM